MTPNQEPDINSKIGDWDRALEPRPNSISLELE